MIIEFIGLPGAGKSTIVNCLIKNTDTDVSLLHYQKHKRKILKKKGAKVSYAFFIIGKLLHLIPITYRMLKGSSKKKLSLKRINSLFIMLYTLAKSKDNSSVLIMDQGLYQMIVSIVIYNKKPFNKDINKIGGRLLEIIKIVDYEVVIVDLPLNIAEERIIARDKEICEFKGMSEKQRKGSLIKYTDLLKKVNIDLICSSENEPKENAFLINDFFFKNLTLK